MRPQTTSSPVKGTRVAAAIASWSGASIAVLASLMLAISTGVAPNRATWLGIVPLLAWVSLAVMTVRWIQNRRCHWLWPIAGTTCGIASAAAFYMLGFLYIAAVPLAIYLVFWHLLRPTGLPLSRKT